MKQNWAVYLMRRLIYKIIKNKDDGAFSRQKCLIVENIKKIVLRF